MEGGDRATAAAKFAATLLFVENQRGAADAFRLEVDCHLNAVSDSDEEKAAVHPVVLAVKGHCPLDLMRCSLVGNSHGQGFGFRNASSRKRARHIIRIWTGLNNFRRTEHNQRVILRIEEVTASACHSSCRFRY